MQPWYQQALNLFFPEVCIHCGAKQQHLLLLCSQCLIELPQQLHAVPSPELLQDLWGLAEYNGPIGSIIRRCKYKPDERIMKSLVHRMHISTVPWSDFDVITHVPTTFSRRFSRGFDQAQLLAKISQRPQQSNINCCYSASIPRRNPLGLTTIEKPISPLVSLVENSLLLMCC